MKSGKSWWTMIGLIIWESITFIDLAVDLYTGEMTVTELIKLLIFCLLLTVIIYYITKRRRHKNRE